VERNEGEGKMRNWQELVRNEEEGVENQGQKRIVNNFLITDWKFY
jgi:hypothetical protein